MKKIIWINLPKQFRKSGVQIYNNHLKKIINHKIKIFNINSYNKQNYILRIYEKYILRYFSIIQNCKKYNTPYVILPDESFLITGIFLYLSKKKPIIIIHDYKSIEIIKRLSCTEKFKYSLLHPFFFFLRNFHYVITVSKTSEKVLKKKFKLKKIIIYNLFNKVNKNKINTNI